MLDDADAIGRHCLSLVQLRRHLGHGDNPVRRQAMGCVTTDLERLPSAFEVWHWQWTPEIAQIGRSLSIPGLWSLWRIVVPRTGIKIAKVLVHLIEFDIELDALIVRIAPPQGRDFRV